MFSWAPPCAGSSESKILTNVVALRQCGRHSESSNADPGGSRLIRVRAILAIDLGGCGWASEREGRRGQRQRNQQAGEVQRAYVLVHGHPPRGWVGACFGLTIQLVLMLEASQEPWQVLPEVHPFLLPRSNATGRRVYRCAASAQAVRKISPKPHHRLIMLIVERAPVMYCPPGAPDRRVSGRFAVPRRTISRRPS